MTDEGGVPLRPGEQVTIRGRDPARTPEEPPVLRRRAGAEIQQPLHGVASFVESPTRHVHWGAILAGILSVLTALTLLTLLGLALGLTLPSTGAAATTTGQIGPHPEASRYAALWEALTAFLAFFVGGYLAARLADVVTRERGAVHGLLVFVACVPLILWLTSQLLAPILGGGLGGYASGLRPGVSSQSAAPPINLATAPTPVPAKTPSPAAAGAGQPSVPPVQAPGQADEIRNGAASALTGAILSLIGAVLGGILARRPLQRRTTRAA